MSIKIHYSFVFYIFILFFLDLMPYYLIFFCCVFIHEITHILFGYLFKIKPISINISAGGLSVDFNNLNISSIKKILIYLSGPFVNIVISVLVYCCFSERYLFLVITNVFLCIFNLLPIYPLDGGKVVLEILTNVFKYKMALVIIKNIYNIFSIAILFIIAYIYINYYNPQILIIGIYILNFSRKNNYENILII